MGTEFHRFLDLPLEIRQMIYRLLLVRGKVFVQPIRPEQRIINHVPDCDYNPCGWYEECDCHISYRYLDWHERNSSFRPPRRINANGLLQGVSKQVQVEATEVFYSAENEFVFGYGQMERLTCILCSTDLHDPFTGQDATDFIHVKRLSVCFDMRDTTTSDPGEVLVEDFYQDTLAVQGIAFQTMGSEVAFHAMDFRDRLELIHELHVDSQNMEWSGKYGDLTMNVTGFQHLQIDLTNCYCPLGCCRRTQHVCESLCDWENGFPHTLEILGARSAAEKGKMLTWLTGVNFGVAVQNHVVFKDDERYWDPVKQNCFWKPTAPST